MYKNHKVKVNERLMWRNVIIKLLSTSPMLQVEYVDSSTKRQKNLNYNVVKFTLHLQDVGISSGWSE